MGDSLIMACSPETFSPSVFGAEILAVDANVVSGLTAPENPDAVVQDFCNVTVSYTHPGQNDHVIVEAWLPIEDYNQRFKAVGGGGWSPGRTPGMIMLMAEALNEGYATITTDAGLVGNDGPVAPWALLSPGNVDLFSLQNLASVSLNDEAVIGKACIRDFYGQEPEFSYWYGCSQGGRQGFMLAQRYPDAFDGIAAYAPAINWNNVLTNLNWAYQVMLNLGEFPHECEFDAIRAAAVTFCDGLDGVVDGVVANVDECVAKFDPFELVGDAVPCGNRTAGSPIKITKAAAIVANETWHGLKTADGEQTWYGFMPGADLTGNDPRSGGLWGPILTDCEEGACAASPNPLVIPWLRDFILKRPDADLGQLTHAEFDKLVHAGGWYKSIIGTDDPDLSAFRKRGGKLVTLHGLDDQLISPKGTEHYYKAVTARDANIHDFFRYFEIPGFGHCSGGSSSLPASLFGQMRTWVENGTAPDSTPFQVTLSDGTKHDRIACVYPQKARLDVCDDPADVACWSCGNSMDEL